MLKHTRLLKAKLEEARRSGYQNPIWPLRPGQESIMVVRPPAPAGPCKDVQNILSVKR
jgi:hypothetical protein